jgi:hypothetical protein
MLKGTQNQFMIQTLQNSMMEVQEHVPPYKEEMKSKENRMLISILNHRIV